jgi:hypothetical protein
MKRILVLIFLVSFSSTFLAFADVNKVSESNLSTNSGFWLNTAKKDDDWNWAIGGRGNRLGVELGFVVNFETPDDMLDYPIGHTSYSDKGWKDDGGLGLDLLTFINSDDVNIDNLPFKFSLYGGVGVYWMEESHVVQSTVTGWNYQQKTRDTTKYPFSYGVQFRGNEKGTLMISIGNHELRGVNIGLGLLY